MRKTKKRRDAEKEKIWRRLIREGARSGLSNREFCRQQRIKENLFYVWRQKIKQRDEEGGETKGLKGKGQMGKGATFALVTDGSEGVESVWIELVLKDGCRVRIGKGVDRDTLVNVLEAVEQRRC
jgi:hypothetical protein